MLQVVILFALAWMDFYKLKITGDLLFIGVQIDKVCRMCAYLTDQHSEDDSTSSQMLYLLKGKHFVVGARGQSCHNLTPFVVGERGLKCY
uniref:Uncharacterized protein n=1 Tax=Tanacetum cinerariifolium TaxID=118510 RepID=A0A699R667_TANCI|nr:hypothetical protein [Tanacetum cinerariifolium]